MPDTANGLPVKIEKFQGRPVEACDDARHGAAGGPGTRKEPPQTVYIQGVPVPVNRDRLQIIVETADAPVFPLDKTPLLFREMVEATHEHVQAPRSLCAQAVLSGIALAAQGLANVDVPSLPEPLPLSLFFFAIAASGERKTALDRVVQWPFSQHEAHLAETYEEDLRRYRNEHMLWESERKKITADKKTSKEDKRLTLEALAEPREPVPPLIRIKEPTFEGIVNLLRKGLTSVGLFTSEGGQFLGGHGMTDDTRMRTMTGLSELWDGGTAQRIRAGEVTRVTGRRVSVSLSVQPKIASTFLGNELARDQGFLARFLVMMPESTIGTREVRAAKSLEDTRIIRFHRRLIAMLRRPQPTREGSGGMELDLPALPLDHGAWGLWQAFADDVERNAGKDGAYQPIQASALKMAENVARIAGALALFEDEDATEVSAASMEAAVNIGRFYLAEALRLLGHEVADPETVALNELANWLEEWPHPLISVTHVQQRAPRALRGSAKKTRERVIALCSWGVLTLHGDGEVAGKPFKETYRINRRTA
ncbi:YfjI family protein [Methylobacterium ajmalii]|uniref:YfjI family protein n=1 Tax=Methylobacterium ajmalii TaxID=2738439 RepID=A0ABV0A587_9HYPH